MIEKEYSLLRSDLDLTVCTIIEDFEAFKKFASTVKATSNELQENGVEVVVVVTYKLYERNFTGLIKSYPLINWIILHPGELQNQIDFGTAIDIFIRESSKKYLLLLNPLEKLDHIDILGTRFLIHFFNSHFVLGYPNQTIFNFEMKNSYYILLAKDMLLKIDVKEIKSDTQFFLDRLSGHLQYVGFKTLKHGIPTTSLKEVDQRSQTSCERLKSNEQTTSAHAELARENYVLPSQINFFSYKTFHFKKEQAVCFLHHYKQFEIRSPEIFEQEFEVIALVQTFNEKSNIIGLLEHLENVCDGVILLDDDSSDYTYDLAKGKNVFIKVQKSRSEIFNDLENRNSLLSLASFINSKYFFFIDADERFDKRYCDIKSLLKKFPDRDAFGFYVANLWNNESEFLLDPKIVADNSKMVAKSHLWQRLRLFRNKGYCQIQSSNSDILHFTCSPFITNIQIIPILLLHYGTLTLDDRVSKYSFYKKNDSKWGQRAVSDYEYLIDDQAKTQSVNNIVLK